MSSPSDVVDPLAEVVAPVCPYCGERTVLMRAGDALADSRNRKRLIYICRPCHAWVGCHPGDIRPLGTPANKELRDLRVQAHAVFDNMRVRLGWSRRESYKWLQHNMSIPAADCHIGMFNEQQCLRVIDLSAQMVLQGRVRV